MAAAALMVAGCSLMTEDLDDCPTGLYVNVVYDYNTQRADMARAHVGWVTVYAFDEEERLVAEKTANRTDGGHLALHFTEQELAPGRRYRLVALGLQRDWNAALQTSGTKYRRTQLATGDLRSSLFITLDHGGTPASTPASAVSYAAPVSAVSYAATVSQPQCSTRADTPASVPNDAPLDTLFHTLTTLTTTDALTPAATRYHLRSDGTVSTNGTEWVSVEPGQPTYVTMSLVRDTKHLNISLREIDTPEQVKHEDYDVFIADRNAVLDADNGVVQTGDSVIYRPYAAWTTRTEGGANVAVDQSAHYDLMFNRLMYDTTGAGANAVLCIRKRDTGDMVALFDLPELLCQGRMAFEIYNYQPQEYLDREYDYRLELFLKGGRWAQGSFVSICVDVLAWSRRIQYWDF